MMDTKFASLFQNGRSQAVRLPKEFRFTGKRVRISRSGPDGILLQPELPKKIDLEKLWRELDALHDESFMADGRQQPEWPPEKENPFD